MARSRTPVHRPSVPTDNLALQSCANRRFLSRPPSRRQPFRSEGWDSVKSVENSAKFSHRLHVEFTAASSGLTVRQHPFSGGVSDHIAGRGLGRPSGHFGWSLTPLLP